MNCINEISATGSVIVVALGLNMTGATKIKIANMLSRSIAYLGHKGIKVA